MTEVLNTGWLAILCEKQRCGTHFNLPLAAPPLPLKRVLAACFPQLIAGRQCTLPLPAPPNLQFHMLKLTICFAPLVLSAWVACTRIIRYVHSPADVTCGM